MAASAPILSLQDLTIGYHELAQDGVLFENLNLKLHASEFVCFMGPNGIGKSTLIRAIAGLHKSFSGAITVAGNTDRESSARSVAVVLTDKVAVANMSVYELVAFGRYPYLD